MSFSTSMLPMGASSPGLSTLASAGISNPLSSIGLGSSAAGPQRMTNMALGGGTGGAQQGGGDILGQLLPMLLTLIKSIFSMFSQLFGGGQPGAQQGQGGQQGQPGTGQGNGAQGQGNGHAGMNANDNNGAQGAGANGNCKPCDSKPPQGQQDTQGTAPTTTTYPTNPAPQCPPAQGYDTSPPPPPPPAKPCPPAQGYDTQPPPAKPPQGYDTQPPQDYKTPQPEEPKPTQPYPPDKPTPDLPKYEGGTTGRVWGDPHFQGFDGEKYTIKGQNGKVYNLLQDKNVTFNGQFDKWGSGTVISETGIQVGDHKVGFNPSQNLGQPATFNGKPMKSGEKVDLGNGQYALWTPGKLTVKTSEYTIKQEAIHMAGGNINNINTDVKLNGDIFADNVKPTGLLGVTADGKGKKNAPTEAMAANYLVSNGLFGENFKNNL